ncbi:molybdopterin-binding protein [Yoonia sediminilitoris]|uniref:Molybdenum cofactor cytidylyltransferase n=1 Tax=Yoonia sediminilitoris TaxID=1286148 RepID=A0A2T6KDY4_9RHOB|nr:molybdopterin-binding protein [Yoonia sediminilitoris]PUB13239.1 molybdenum cofactor cytidylyltransferase [Yoonia sediminilitoris]RCW94574.1 molybdenum cofactor cytidylyltransferase [Yoonia sediminilitoris]
MKFGGVPVGEAEGTILAHSIALGKSRLRKGHHLSADDLQALAAAGHEMITVARLGPDDLDEDQAAATLAEALAQPDLRHSNAATGRVNLFATGPGVAVIDRAAIDQFNAVNPMITVATVPPFHRVEDGAMIATVKVISYGVPQIDVAKACAAGKGALGLLPPRYQTATLIETRTDKTPSSKGRAALRGRLDRLGVALDDRVVVAHKTDALSEAIRAATGQVIFVLTASATSDPCDVGPEALRRAGGTVTQFGIPVDPGNLLFLGALGERPVIGLPGCARSPALNGADWVLERVICGLDLGPTDFAAMGVGGLLKEIPTRPKPRGDI